MAKQIVNKDNIIIPVGTMEDFKRPSHPDFMDTTELKAAKFSGLRNNNVTLYAEIWIEGEVVKSISPLAMSADPLAINKAMEEVFALDNIMPDIPELRKYRENKA